jgi:amidohydrolase
MSAELETLLTTRRDLHRHPELAFQEHRTAGIVAERLRAAGYDVRTGVARTGVVGEMRGAGDGPVLLLRADMDALPITEETAHDYVSTIPGAMHACGHDAHVAIALAVAERLARTRGEWSGTVRFVFQPAEEVGNGARAMIEEGVLDGVDAALGLHVWTGLPSGELGVTSGSLMASAASFEARVTGRGGHGAIPHEAVDPVYLATLIVQAWQGLVSRFASPLDAAVITVTSIHAGEAYNVIPEAVVMRGTVRAFDAALTRELEARMGALAEGVCGAWGASFDLDLEINTPPTVNDARVTEVVRSAAVEVAGAHAVHTGPEVRTMGAEDFGEFLQRVPGCFFFVGAGSPEAGAVHPHHSPRFEICERSLPLGVEVMERAARALLA